MDWIEGRVAAVTGKQHLAFLGLLAVAMAVRLLLLPVEPPSIPLYHDEFSYLLGADTLAHGRLTNPQPPIPLAFETIHTNMWPTYQSMYMPGTSLVLLFGRLVGMPWLSVLVVTALFCAGVYWMVAGWLPRGYAVAAGFAAMALTVASTDWWFDNYFCIALPALAGAMVLGAVPRIAARRHGAGVLRSTAILGVGLAALILTRPYEGFMISFPCVAVLVWDLRPAGLRRLGKLACIPTLILAGTFAWLLYYNWRGTGHPLLFPYMLNYREYHITGPFLFSPVKAVPVYHNQMLARFFREAELPQHDFVTHHPVLFLIRKITVYYLTFLFGFGALLLAGVVYLVRHARHRLLLAPLLAFVGFLVELVLMAWAPFPQYAAPAGGLLLLLVAFGGYSIRRVHHRFWDGRRIARGFVLAEILVLISVVNHHIRRRHVPPEPQYVSIDRSRVEQELLKQPGKQLCLVRYTPGHDGWQEWVFNGADPVHAQLVWARSLDPETDRQLIAAFPGRSIWLARPDEAGALLARYDNGQVMPLPPNPYRKGPN